VSPTDLQALREVMHPTEVRGHTQWRGRLDGDGPRVLLIMGFGMPGIIWQPIIARLHPEHEIAWYDSRGMGRSTLGDDEITMALLADDAAAVLDALGWDTAHVVGVSMGGMVAQHLALRHSDRVESLGLIATTPGPFWRFAPPIKGISRFLRANLSKGEARLEALASLLYPEHLIHHDPRHSVPPALLQVLSHPASREARTRQLRAIMAHDVVADLPRLRMPSLVVRPALDVLVPPRASDALHAGLPGSRLLRLPDAGHGALHQEAPRIVHALRDLWSTT